MLKNSLSAPMALLAIILLCLTAFADENYVGEYQMAVSGHYAVPLEEVTQVLEAGITEEELPVVFYIAEQAGVSPTSVVKSRKEAKSWFVIAADNNVTTSDFYVQVTGKRHGARFSKIYAKFSALSRDKFDQVALTDGEIVALVNLKFLYKYYNYSQHLIMTWSGEGKSFVEINHQVFAATSEMAAKQLAGGDE